MNTPERIWINPTIDLPKLSGGMDKNSVEYIHKDAFVDKTFEFFGEHLWEYIDVKNANCDTFINIDGDKLKEDFRNYMKGK